MVRVLARAREDADGSRTDGRWFLSSLVAWLFVGITVGQLGIAVVQALTISPGLAQSHALVIVLSVTVGLALLAHDVEPSLPAAVTFFFLSEFFNVLSVLIGRGSVLSGSTLTPWEAVGFRAFAVAVAFALVFAGVGWRAVRWLQSQLRSILDVPPQESQRRDER